MTYLQIIRNFSSKHNTWCYQQGYYQSKKFKKLDHYAPLICKFLDVPIANGEIAKNTVPIGIIMKKNGLF